MIRSLLRCGLSLAVSLMVATTAFGQTTSSNFTVELFVDNDPGFGKGLQYTTSLTDNELTLPIAEIKPGAHIISVRVCDENGLWSPTVTNPLYISDEQPYSAAEFFIDTDPGAGNGVKINAGGKMLTFAVPTSDLTLGTHTLGARIQDMEGRWSDVMTRPFIVTAEPVNADNFLEYFFDKDPGVGNASQLPATTGTNVFFLPTESLTAGAHIISVRCRDKDGLWSPTVTNPLYVVEPLDVTSVEYFVDKDPGYGKGTAVALPADGNVSFSVPTHNLNVGEHRLVLRGATPSGNYVTIFEAPFKVDDGGAVETVLWVMSVDVYRNGSDLIVEAKDVLPGSIVEIYSVNGVSLKRAKTDGESETVTYSTAGQTGPFIVVVNDPEGHRFVRRIL